MPNLENYGKNVSESWMKNVQPVIENWAKNNKDEVAKFQKLSKIFINVYEDLQNKSEAGECGNNPCCYWSFPPACNNADDSGPETDPLKMFSCYS